MGFEFDVENFGLGVLAGWASAYAINRLRKALRPAPSAARQRSEMAQKGVSHVADSRYYRDLIEICQTGHLAGRGLRLSDIVVEPRFIPQPDFAEPPDDDVIQDVFYVVPQIPDFPYLHAPYNVSTLSIEDLSKGERAVALIGLPGSGRTTALQAIALWAMGEIDFKPPKDRVQEELEQEEAKLSADERAKRIKDRIFIEEQARERLAEEQGKEYDPDAEISLKSASTIFRRILPVYVHLANVSVADFRGDVDPAEPLVRAVQYQMQRITAKVLPRNLYHRLNNGQALVLIDGLDDLPADEQKMKLVWLGAFIEQYRRNYIIVAGPAQGYGGLTEIGLTPVFLRPWNDLDIQNAINNWSTAWPKLLGGGRRRRGATMPENRLIAQAAEQNRALSPLEITLKIWSVFSQDSDLDDYESWLRGYITRFLPQDMVMGVVLPRIAQAAALQLNEGFITASRLEAVLMDQLTSAASSAQSHGGGEITSQEESDDALSVFDSAAEDDLDALFADEDEQAGKAPVPPAKPQKATEKQPLQQQKEVVRLGKEVAQLLTGLHQSGLLVLYRGGRYQFRHAFLAAYLASLTLEKATDEQLVTAAAQPAWSQALAYASMHTNLEAAVGAKFSAPADILHNNLLDVSRWLAYAGPKTGWRGEVLKQLGNLLVAPQQYSLVRERIMAALVGTRDTNVHKIFRVAARSENPDLRRLACLAFGAVGDPDSIVDISPLLRDPNEDVQLSAALGLSALGSEEALELMAAVLTDPKSELQRRVITESFAAIPEEGYPVLYDAVNHEEMMLRRAAIFGLSRIKTDWALIAIYRSFLEDPEYYVRDAAQQVFLDMQVGKDVTVKNYPRPQNISWLLDWFRRQSVETPAELPPEEILLHALRDGDHMTRRLAALAIGQLGLEQMAAALYSALRDREAAVRDMAHRGLGYLQLHLGQALPAPV